jgi:predicted NBD/HSP70 family sugar kinase
MRRAKDVRLTAERLADELARYEREHSLSSAEFFERYQAGDIDHSNAMTRWAWLCSVAVRSGVSLSASVARGALR